MSNQQQPYDSSMKGLFKEDFASILPHILEEAQYISSLDIEILRAPMRVDRVCLIRYKGRIHILHLEFQAGPDDDMAHRLHVYHANIWRDHKLPVITIVIYLFECSLPESPLIETDADGEVLRFRFHVLALWLLDARKYVQKHAISMYPLLPTMEYADASMLLQAIEEMVQYYQDNETKLGFRLLWFKTFLERTTTVSLEDKNKVEERLDTLDQLLEQSSFVLKQRERGKEEGGLQMAQQILIDLVNIRYPTLAELAQNRAEHTKEPDALREVINLIVAAPDENIARFILSTPSAA